MSLQSKSTVLIINEESGQEDFRREWLNKEFIFLSGERVES